MCANASKKTKQKNTDIYFLKLCPPKLLKLWLIMWVWPYDRITTKNSVRGVLESHHFFFSLYNDSASLTLLCIVGRYSYKQSSNLEWNPQLSSFEASRGTSAIKVIDSVLCSCHWRFTVFSKCPGLCVFHFYRQPLLFVSTGIYAWVAVAWSTSNKEKVEESGREVGRKREGGGRPSTSRPHLYWPL